MTSVRHDTTTPLNIANTHRDGGFRAEYASGVYDIEPNPRCHPMSTTTLAFTVAAQQTRHVDNRGTRKRQLWSDGQSIIGASRPTGHHSDTSCRTEQQDST